MEMASTGGDGVAAQFARETDAGGRFVRQVSAFRDRVTADGSSGFPAIAGRYHLYVSLACPWAHRAILWRSIKGLEAAISMTVVDPIRDERGWAFREGTGHGMDPVNGFSFLSEAYEATAPGFDGRVTVPVLWDTVAGRIVSNESAEIVEMFDREFDAVAARPDLHLFDPLLRDRIDALNADVYRDVNNGVYQAGFATTQSVYEEACRAVFRRLDVLEASLLDQRYLLGDCLTPCDWRLFTTVVRFDSVYHGHFKCNLRRIVDYPSLSGWLRELYQMPGIAQTVDFDHIKRHYYVTHRMLNPTGIIPIGPDLDLGAPHGRDHLPARTVGWERS